MTDIAFLCIRFCKREQKNDRNRGRKEHCRSGAGALDFVAGIAQIILHGGFYRSTHGGAEKKSIAVVSVAGSLIEDLYVLPAEQNKGFGSTLLRYAISQCTEKPTLWILENNTAAARLYRRFGFEPTGRRKAITDRLDEIEFALEPRQSHGKFL